ncbi:MAG TPA: hypothetical protein VHE08_08735 [Solirubrobacterales bacterium]|nr:hypothetical protein [Solirubrobacterales bacterium]
MRKTAKEPRPAVPYPQHSGIRNSWLGVGGLGWRLAMLLTFVVLLGSVAVAAAAEAPSRAEYVARLEGICKPRAAATQVAMRGAKGDLKAERLAIAAGKFAKAARIFGGTVAKISAVPRPTADVAKLGTWFTYLNRQESYLKQITAQLRAGRAIPAQRLTARFIHNGNLANNSVIAFGFNYCSFKFSRYG